MRNIWKQTIFLSTLIVLAIGAGLYFVFTIGAANQTFGETTLSGNFGSNVGIYDFTKSTEGGLDGLPATTVTFNMSASNPDKMAGLEYLNKFMKEKVKDGSTELVNVKAISDDETNPFTFQFYANSPSDYLDGTFSDTYNNFREVLVDNSFSNILFVSKPTANGSRAVSIDAQTVVSGNGTAKSLESSWSKLTSKATAFPTDGSRYTLSLTSEDDRKMAVSGFFYDEESLKTLSSLNPRIFVTLDAYTNDEAKSQNIILAKYIVAQGAGSNDSEFQLTVGGEQPDQATVNGWIASFTGNFYAQEEERAEKFIDLPAASITIVKYENSTEAVYISYPTNMEW